MPDKPLGMKAYGSIPHLPGSRLGFGDHHVTDGQARICTEKARDRHDFITVTEKLDGSNVAVAKINGVCVPLIRAGYPAISSHFEQHHLFAQWAYTNYARFDGVLEEGERLVGEWLAQAHGTRYTLTHEPFVVFDLMRGQERAPFGEFSARVVAHFVVPHVLHSGSPFSIGDAMAVLANGSNHGALDPVEGAVWRVERRGKVDFLAKLVRTEKVDGRYLPEITGDEPVWNWRPAPSVDELAGIAPWYTGGMSSDEFIRHQRDNDEGA